MTTLNLLTPPKAAKILGVSYVTMRKFLARQELTTITIGQRTFISEESLSEYLAKRTRPCPQTGANIAALAKSGVAFFVKGL